MAGLLLLLAPDAWAQQAPVSTTSAGPRLRLGGSVGVGAGSYGLGAAASARIGIQMTPYLAASYQISRAGSGDFWGDNEDWWTSHALMLEFMVPGRMFAIGLGPSLASGRVETGCFAILTECDPPRTSESYNALGFDGRIAYTFGANRPEVRGGFTLEFGVHASPHGGVGIFGIGFDLF
jgi:hypothetical protein